MTQGKKIETVTIQELFNEATSGSFPILADICHDNIVWGDSVLGQENHHLRLINDPTRVVYNKHTYLPAHFVFNPPSEDGKKIGNASITVSAIDKRIIQVIRSINDIPPVLTIEAFFAKKKTTTNELFIFSKLYSYEFSMISAQWDSVTAKWELVFDTTMQTNVPMDTANPLRCPAVNQD